MKSIEILEKESVGKAIWKLCSMSTLGMLMQGIYTIVDTAFVAGIGADEVSGVAMVVPINYIIIAFAMIFGIGAASLISLALGKKNTALAKDYLQNGYTLLFWFGILLTALIALSHRTLLSALGAKGAILNIADTYMWHLNFGTPFILFTLASASYLRAQGMVKESTVISILNTLINMGLDALFVYWGYGIIGIAWATVIAFVVSSGLQWYYLQKKENIIPLLWNKLTLYKRLSWEIFYLGFPNFGKQLATFTAIAVFNYIAIGYDKNLVAAWGICTGVFSVGLYIIYGFSHGFMPLAGYNLGAARYDRVHQLIRWSFGSLSLLFVLIGIGLYALRKPIMTTITTNTDVQYYGERIIMFQSLTLPLTVILILGGSLLQSAGKATLSTVVSLSRQFIAYMPVLLVMVWLNKKDYLVASQAMAELLSFIFAGVLLFAFYKSLPSKDGH